jgi:hypothetical protein
MADSKKSKRKRATKRERKERRFVPEQTYASRVSIAAGMLGSFALGAGVYGQWVSDHPRSVAPYLFGAGALVVAGAMWFADSAALPLRIGGAGVALEKGSEFLRVYWCDMERVFVEKTELVVKGKETTLRIPIAAQPSGLAWLLSEGTKRVPEAMDVKRSALQGLREIGPNDGELVVIDGLQIAGRHCAASDKPISFERDARLCPQCGQVYLKDQVPRKCVTCHADLENSAIEV